MSNDAVGGLLRGFNNGLSSGLDFYKTIQGEARAKRQETLQAQRYATEDERWERNWDRQTTQDEAAANQLTVENTRADAQLKHAEDELEFKREDAKARAAALAAYRQATLNNKRAETSTAAAKEAKRVREQTIAGMQSFLRGDKSDMANLATWINKDPVAIRQAIDLYGGTDVPDEQIARMRIIPADDGSGVTIGMMGDDGKLGMWDSDGDGKPDNGLFVSKRDLSARIGGQAGATVAANEAARSEHVTNATLSAADNAGRTATAITPRIKTLSGQVAGFDAVAEEKKKEIARLQDIVSEDKGYGRNPRTAAGREAQRKLEAAETWLSNFDKETSDAREQLKELNATIPKLEAAPRQAYAAAQDDAALVADNVPIASVAPTLRNFGRVADQYGEGVARDSVGKSPSEARDVMNAGVDDLTKRVIEGIDLPVSFNGNGTPSVDKSTQNQVVNLVRALPKGEQQLLRDNPDALAALSTAFTIAHKKGMPQAALHINRAISQGLDGEFVADAMQNSSLRGAAEPVRATLATAAAQIKQREPALAEKLGVDGLLMEARVRMNME